MKSFCYKRLLFLFLICSIQYLAPARGTAVTSIIVNTRFGPVEGVHYPPNYDNRKERNPRVIKTWPIAYLGIPFAEAPVGQLRFKDPLPWNKTWDAVRKATKFGPQCYQNLGFFQIGETSEDCLYINIFTPPKSRMDQLRRKEVKLPVIFWIFGGAFMFGAAGTGGVGDRNLYVGSFLTSYKDVILVTFNHRTAALGFLKTNKLQGNYGIMDQKLAFQWTFDNIGQFGGNPFDITIHGMSSGSYTGLMLAADPDLPVVKRVIAMSPPLGLYPRPVSKAIKGGESFLKEAGCNRARDEVKCLQSISINDIMKATRNSDQGWFSNALTDPLKWLPVNDEKRLVQNPLSLVNTSDQRILDRLKNIDIIFGLARNEAGFFISISEMMGYLPGGTLFMLKGNETTWDFIKDWLRGDVVRKKKVTRILEKSGKSSSTFAERQYVNVVMQMFGEDEHLIVEILKQYEPKTKLEGVIETIIDIITDYMFICPVQKMANFTSEFGKSSTYLYHYDHKPAYIAPYVRKRQFKERMVWHATDVPFFWNYLPKLPVEDQFISHMYADYFTSFASGKLNSHCNPMMISKPANEQSMNQQRVFDITNNGCTSTLPIWKEYDSSTRKYLSFGNTKVQLMTGGLRLKQCAFWKKIKIY